MCFRFLILCLSGGLGVSSSFGSTLSLVVDGVDRISVPPLLSMPIQFSGNISISGSSLSFVSGFESKDALLVSDEDVFVLNPADEFSGGVVRSCCIFFFFLF